VAAGPTPTSPPPKRRGPPEEIYEFSGILMGVAWFGVILAVAFNLFMWLPLGIMKADTPSEVRDRRDGRIFALVILVGSAGSLAWALGIAKSRFLLYEDALVQERDGEKTEIRFENCELRGFFGRLSLKDRAGRTVTVSQYTGNRHQLRHIMAKRITALQIQGARDRLRQGMTLIFGPFRLTTQALGHEQRRLPWEQVGEVRAVIIWGRGNRSRLTIYQHMKVLPWAYSFRPHDDIPNVDMFLQLLKECKARQLG
jgi:hypothetical protein